MRLAKPEESRLGWPVRILLTVRHGLNDLLLIVASLKTILTHRTDHHGKYTQHWKDESEKITWRNLMASLIVFYFNPAVREAVEREWLFSETLKVLSQNDRHQNIEA